MSFTSNPLAATSVATMIFVFPVLNLNRLLSL
jgi:hypothetical protein